MVCPGASIHGTFAAAFHDCGNRTSYHTPRSPAPEGCGCAEQGLSPGPDPKPMFLLLPHLLPPVWLWAADPWGFASSDGNPHLGGSGEQCWLLISKKSHVSSLPSWGVWVSPSCPPLSHMPGGEQQLREGGQTDLGLHPGFISYEPCDPGPMPEPPRDSVSFSVKWG